MLFGISIVKVCVRVCVCVCPTVLVSLSDAGVIVEFWVPQHLSVRPGLSCGLRALPQEDLPAQGSST